MRKGDLIAARAPFRRRRAPAEEAYPALICAIGVHDIDLLAARPVALEHDLGAVGRIAAAHIDTGRIRQPGAGPAIGRNAVNVSVAVHRHGIEDRLAIGRPARRESGVLALRHELLRSCSDVIDIDARVAVQIAEIDNRLIIGRIARGQRGRLASGDEAVIGPIAVHDRQLLGPVILRPGFRDISDLAVKERTFAGQPRIDEIRAFMRPAPPVRRLQRPPAPHQFTLQLHIVEIAADGQRAIGRGIDIALHQHVGITTGPGLPRRCGDVGIGRLRQRVRPHREEQAVVPQISSDDPGDLLAQRRGPSRAGGSAAISVRRKAGNGDAQILPCLFIRD